MPVVVAGADWAIELALAVVWYGFVEMELFVCRCG